MKLDERHCLEEIVAGNDVWARFWQKFGFIIVSEVSRFRFSDPSIVDEIYQDLCLKLLRNKHAIIRRYLLNPFRGSFAALLRKITRNMLIDHYRKHKQLITVSADFIDLGSKESPAESYSANPQRHYLKQNGVSDLLLDIAGGDRESETFQILHLRFIEGLRVSVIAERFGMKPNTVTQRLKYNAKKFSEKYKFGLMEIIDET